MKTWITNIAGLLVVLMTCGHVYAQKSHGLEFDAQQYKNTVHRPWVIDTKARDLPGSASVKQFAPKPLSQRMEYTSPGWASAYAARTILEAKKLGLRDQREITQISYSPVFNYHLAKPDESSDCSVPVKLPDVLKSMKKYGVPRYVDFRKSCPTNIPDEIYIKAYENRISDYFKVFEEDDKPLNKIEGVKKSLANGSPVIIGMYSARSFQTVSGDFWQARENLDKATQPGHALVVVGYDDYKYTGAFEVMNSWGTDWGNEGFMWVRYKDFAEFTNYGFELLIVDGNENSNSKLSVEVKIPFLDNTSMEFSLVSENDGYYKTIQSIDDFTSFNLVIQSDNKTFVYVIGSDQTEEIYDIFPDPWLAACIPYENHKLVIPELGIDDTPGSNYLGIIFSDKELSMSYIFDRLNNLRGKDFGDKFFIAFNDVLVSPDRVNYSTDAIRFESTKGKNDIVGVIIEILHN